MDNEHRIPAHPPVPEGFQREGRRRVMLMTPQMALFGGMLAFFTVVVMVVILPTNTYSAEPSQNWAPLSDAALRGRATFLANGCVYCHSGFSRPQDVASGLYYLYPRVSEPGDYVASSESPNVFGSQRTGPDLSQEGGNHPDGWHQAHYDNPRNTMPFSIMPQFGFWSDSELQDMIAFNQAQGGKEGALRYAAVTVGGNLMRINGGAMNPQDAFPDLVAQLQADGTFHADGAGSDKSPSGLPWKLVWHMNSFARSYWLTENPLQVTQQNLIRGRQVFERRCVGCHGAGGAGDGPAAEFLAPKPFDFTNADEMANAGASDGEMYHRILTAGPGTAMENFGTRLSVQDIWRVVLFLRTVPNGGLNAPLPSVDMWERWQAPEPMLNYIENHPIEERAPDTSSDPFLAAALWVSPGIRPGDEILVGGQLPMTLDRLESLIRDEWERRLTTAYEDAQARGDDLPPLTSILETEGLTFHAP